MPIQINVELWLAYLPPIGIRMMLGVDDVFCFFMGGADIVERQSVLKQI